MKIYKFYSNNLEKNFNEIIKYKFTNKIILVFSKYLRMCVCLWKRERERERERDSRSITNSLGALSLSLYFFQMSLELVKFERNKTAAIKQQNSSESTTHWQSRELLS